MNQHDDINCQIRESLMTIEDSVRELHRLINKQQLEWDDTLCGTEGVAYGIQWFAQRIWMALLKVKSDKSHYPRLNGSK